MCFVDFYAFFWPDVDHSFGWIEHFDQNVVQAQVGWPNFRLFPAGQKVNQKSIMVDRI
jgi:hypothetical protein